MAVIAHYKLNDNAATDTVIDDIGANNGAIKDAGGTATTAAHTAANSRGVGTVLDFDGTDDYIEIADNIVFSPILTPFSISVWVYMHDATNFEIASKGALGADGEWQLYAGSDDILRFVLYDEDAAALISRKYNTVLTTTYENKWVHIVGIYNGGIINASIKIYLNGTRVDDAFYKEGTFVAVENLTHAIWIGRHDTDYANGLIDNVMIYDIELNPDQVKVLYHGGHGTEIAAVTDESRRIKRR